MPQRRTAIKDLRKNQTRHMHNLDIRTDLKKTIKEFLKAASNKTPKSAEALKKVYKKLDKAAKRHIIHKKTAARRKARFAKLVAAK